MKRSIIPVAAFIAGMAIVPSVFAAGTYNVSNIASWSDLTSCLTNTADSVTCTLSDSVTISGTSATTITSANVTLNLNGHNVKYEATTNTDYLFKVQGGAGLTINGEGAISTTDASSTAGIVAVTADANGKATTLNVAENVTLAAQKAPAIGVYGNSNSGKGVTVTTAGTVTAADYDAIQINGAIKNDAPTINVSGTVTGSGAGSVGIYQAGLSTLNVTNATVTGESGIATKAGTLNITNSTIHGTGDANTPAEVDGGVTPYGAALQIEVNDSYAGKVKITATGSALISDKGSAIQAYGNGTVSKPDTLTLTNVKLEGGSETLPVYDLRENGGFTGETSLDGEEMSTTYLAQLNAAGGYTSEGYQAPAADEGEDEGEENENPNTADTIATYLTIAAVALLGLGATAFVAKKSNR